MLGEIDTTGDDWESLDAEDFPMEEAEQKQNLPTNRQINQPRQRQTESVNRQTDPSAGQRQLMPHSQFPADDRIRQIVPTRWWEQQRQQIQPHLGKYEEQVPPPRQ